MNATRHINPEDLALYAMQFLNAEQNDQVLSHLDGCAECRTELALTHGDLAIVAATAEMHSPPAQARERLLQAVAREPKLRAATPARPSENSSYRSASPGDGFRSPAVRMPSFGSRRAHDEDASGSGAEVRSVGNAQVRQPRPSRQSAAARILPWTGWAVAAGLALVFSQAMHERNDLREEVESVNHQIAQITSQSNEARRLKETLDDPTAQRVTLTLAKQAPVPQGKATYVPAKGALIFVANNLEPLEPAKTYELWIIPAGGSAPVAAGTFHPDAGGNASLILPHLPLGITAKAFGITVEEEGGSQTPTMPILLAGAAGL